MLYSWEDFWADAKLSHLFFLDLGSILLSSDDLLFNLRSEGEKIIIIIIAINQK